MNSRGVWDKVFIDLGWVLFLIVGIEIFVIMESFEFVLNSVLVINVYMCLLNI